MRFDARRLTGDRWLRLGVGLAEAPFPPVRPTKVLKRGRWVIVDFDGEELEYLPLHQTSRAGDAYSARQKCATLAWVKASNFDILDAFSSSASSSS